MKRTKSLLSIVFILLLLMISSRYVFFRSYVRSQKVEFRRQLIAEHSSNTKTILLSEAEIYKNHGDYEWKEENKELVIKGIYHEVLSIKNG